jgi:predicted negative regulator of RcsB-dependent stress response
MWRAEATPLRVWAMAEAEEIDAGIGELRQGIAAFSATGNQFLRPLFLGLLAAQSARRGRAQEGLLVLDAALDAVHATDERCWEADLYWRRGVILHQLQQAPEARIALERALEVARSQGARAFECRAAASFASLDSMPPRATQ